MKNPFTVIQQVNEDMIDHNGHMHDAHYNMVLAMPLNNSIINTDYPLKGVKP